MTEDPDPAGLLDRTAAEELLTDSRMLLPESIGRPPAPPPPSPARRRIVGTGATLTGVTLLGGIALIVAGAIDAISSGSGTLAVVAIVLGIILVSTHWGWVHVAEFTATAIEGHRDSEFDRRRHQWLLTIEPYTRYEVTTEVGPDGSLTISTIRHRPTPASPGHFTFLREVAGSERHSDEQPAAVVAGRAEELRRQAALLTERERMRYETAASAHQRALLGEADEEERLRARRAASEALAEQINTNLKDPPLTE